MKKDTRTPKEMAMDIFNGDLIAKKELEKMMGKKLGEMTQEEKRIGVTCLSAFDGMW